jgi:hypothetical protein
LGLATESEEGKEGGVCFGCHRWWGQLEDVVGDVDADVSSIRHVGKKYESLWMESREGGEALNGTVSAPSVHHHVLYSVLVARMVVASSDSKRSNQVLDVCGGDMKTMVKL